MFTRHTQTHTDAHTHVLLDKSSYASAVSKLRLAGVAEALDIQTICKDCA